MSNPVTEIAYLPIKPSFSLQEGEGKQIWDETLKTITQQEGCEQLMWGVKIEDEGVVQMVIDWTTLHHHQSFISSPLYAPFLAQLSPLLNGPPHLFHLTLPVPAGDESTTPSSPFDAPVTECLSLFFDPAVDEKTYNASFSTFAAEAAKVEGVGAMGLVGGWGVEEHEGEDGGKKKFFGAFVGWPSVQKHGEFREREEFPRVVGFLREGTLGVKVHHVAFERFGA
jgi:quinol monooxygenase YgiN